jgi:Ca2+-transporting ATPase
MELIINPACAIVFEAEPEESNVMRLPPRDQNEMLFGGKIMLSSLLQGSAALAVAVAIYAWALSAGMNEDAVRALVFVAMVAGNIALIFSNRTLDTSGGNIIGRHNPALWWMVLGASAGLTIVLSVPMLRELFHFSGDTPHILGVGVLAAFSVLLLSAGIKRIMRIQIRT